MDLQKIIFLSMLSPLKDKINICLQKGRMNLDPIAFHH